MLYFQGSTRQTSVKALYLWFTILELTFRWGGGFHPLGVFAPKLKIAPPTPTTTTTTTTTTTREGPCFATFSLDTVFNPGFKGRVQNLKKLSPFVQSFIRPLVFLRSDKTLERELNGPNVSNGPSHLPKLSNSIQIRSRLSGLGVGRSYQNRMCYLYKTIMSGVRGHCLTKRTALPFHAECQNVPMFIFDKKFNWEFQILLQFIRFWIVSHGF